MIKANKIIYALFIFFLPFTAMGQLYEYLGVWSQNASFIFLLMGICVTLYVYIYIDHKKLKFDLPVKIFLIFIFVNYIITIAISCYFYFSNSVNDFSIIKNAIFKLWTLLLVFLSFYYPYLYISSKRDILFTIRILLLSLTFIILYGYIQVFALFNPGSIAFTVYMKLQNMFNYSWIEMVNNLNEVPQILLHKRIILTNQEPSIAAFALQVLYLPFLISSIISKYYLTAFRKLHMEVIFLILSLVVLIFTFSTGGYITLVAQAIICMGIIAFIKKNQYINSYFWSANELFFTIIILLILIGAIFVIIHNHDLYTNFRIAINKVLFSDYGRGSAETRIGSIVAGIKLFLDYPLFGVGVGNSNYFLDKYFPEWALNSEVLTYFQNKHALVPKSIWIRLLAEGGTIGIAPFLYFIIVLIKKYVALIKRKIDNYTIFLVSSLCIFCVSLFIHGLNASVLTIIFQWALFGFFTSAVQFEE